MEDLQGTEDTPVREFEQDNTTVAKPELRPEELKKDSNSDPEALLIFYHGGPFGDVSIYPNVDTDVQGGTVKLFQETYNLSLSKEFKTKGAIIAPAAIQYFGVQTGKQFLEENYDEGDKVLIYGYSYGGDNAVNLAEEAEELGIPVEMLVIVDSSDGPGRGISVDNTSIPDNVNVAFNFFQTHASGKFSAIDSSSDSDNPNSSKISSSDGTFNIPG